MAARVEDIQVSSHVVINVSLRSAKAKVQGASLAWECLDVSFLCVSPVSLCHPDRSHLCHPSITSALSSPSSLCVLLSSCVQYLVYSYELTGCIYINCVLIDLYKSTCPTLQYILVSFNCCLKFILYSTDSKAGWDTKVLFLWPLGHHWQC